jgi:hypothetical protein
MLKWAKECAVYTEANSQGNKSVAETILRERSKALRLLACSSRVEGQARDDFLAPLILPATTLRKVLGRRMMLLIWHVVAPGTVLRELV